MTFKKIGAIAVAVWGLTASGAFAQSSETVKIAYIDPLSGFMAATGEHGLKEFQYAADQINARGGVWAGSWRSCRWTTSCRRRKVCNCSRR